MKVITLRLKVPKLGEGDCIVPGSLKVTANLENKNTKSWFLNNISALLQANVMVKLGNTEVYHNVQESNFLLYKDLWQSEEDRKTRECEGIASENTRKLMSGDDSGSGTGSSSNIKDKMISDLYKDKIEIPVGRRIIYGQGLFAPRALDSELDIDIKVPKGDEIMKAQSSQSVAGYKLTCLKLKFDKLKSQEMYNQLEQSYTSGCSWPYRFIESGEVDSASWVKSSTRITMRSNLPRRSMIAAVFLFKDDTKDSEKFVYPNIDNVRVTIEGVPNALYTNALEKAGFYESARDFFLDYEFNTVTPREFFKDKFALVVDMRAVNDKNVYGNGREIINTQAGVTFEINKRATTKDLTCYMYIISDGMIDIQNKQIIRVSK